MGKAVLSRFSSLIPEPSVIKCLRGVWNLATVGSTLTACVTWLSRHPLSRPHGEVRDNGDIRRREKGFVPQIWPPPLTSRGWGGCPHTQSCSWVEWEVRKSHCPSEGWSSSPNGCVSPRNLLGEAVWRNRLPNWWSVFPEALLDLQEFTVPVSYSHTQIRRKRQKAAVPPASWKQMHRRESSTRVFKSALSSCCACWPPPVSPRLPVDRRLLKAGTQELGSLRAPCPAATLRPIC